MTTLHQAERAADVTRILTQNIAAPVSDGALRLFRVLHQGSVEAAEHRNYSPGVTHVTIHCPAEAVADALGCHRVTVWRHARELRELGLIDARAHKGTLRGETRNTGMCWQVRLDPNKGRAPRLSYDDLKHPYRDLDADVRRGRTVYRMRQQRKAEDVQQSKDPSTDQVDMSHVRAWVIPRRSKPPLGLTVASPEQRSLEAVLDVQAVPRGERNRMVELAAEALASALRDRDSVSFYQKLLWQLLRVSDRGAGEHFYQVYLAACRARADVAEGYGRKPGAVFVSRLKAAPWWSTVWAAPPRRVGTLPA